MESPSKLEMPHRMAQLVYLAIPNFDNFTLNQHEVDLYKTPNMGNTNPNGKDYNRAHDQRNSKIEQSYSLRVKKIGPKEFTLWS